MNGRTMSNLQFGLQEQPIGTPTERRFMEPCVFCEYAASKEGWLAETADLFAIYDKYPVKPLHILIVSKQHVGDYLDLNHNQMGQLSSLLQSLTNLILREDSSVNGFNVGANCGRAAGQTIIHCHYHIIPRHHGDMEDPRGGIRGCIPDKRTYD